MITTDKVAKTYYIIDDFNKNFDEVVRRSLSARLPTPEGKLRRNRKEQMSDSEIMTIIVCYHMSGYKNFKTYYIHIYVRLCIVISRLSYPTTGL